MKPVIESRRAGDLRAGPLGAYVASFEKTLNQSGYKPTTVYSKILILAELDQWMRRSGLSVTDIDDQQVRQFIRCRHAKYRSLKSFAATATLFQFLGHLRGNWTIRRVVERVPCKETAEIKAKYAAFLRDERGLGKDTIAYHLFLIDLFLAERIVAGSLRLNSIQAGDVATCVLRHARTIGLGRAKAFSSVLRSFLRFLFLREEIPCDLAQWVPTVGRARLETPPKFISPADVRRLIRVCNRKTAIGRRNYAILLLLARLGLRAGEIVRMTLDDFDWENGEFVISNGKGRRGDRLPISADVGRALADYLRQDRPCCSSRHVFIRSKAPYRGLARSSSIGTIVRNVIDRVGLQTPTKGPHLLRHSLATDLLRRGASMEEIGGLLRHRSVAATNVYAKVDMRSLREAAQPWPGGVS